MISAAYQGFRTSFAVGEGGVVPTVTSIVGAPPQEIRVFSRGTASDQILEELSEAEINRIRQPAYRERVF